MAAWDGDLPVIDADLKDRLDVNVGQVGGQMGKPETAPCLWCLPFMLNREAHVLEVLFGRIEDRRYDKLLLNHGRKTHKKAR